MKIKGCLGLGVVVYGLGCFNYFLGGWGGCLAVGVL